MGACRRTSAHEKSEPTSSEEPELDGNVPGHAVQPIFENVAAPGHPIASGQIQAGMAVNDRPKRALRLEHEKVVPGQILPRDGTRNHRLIASDADVPWGRHENRRWIADAERGRAEPDEAAAADLKAALGRHGPPD